MLTVSVATLVFGSGKTERPLPKVHLSLVSQRLSGRDIIANAVREQMKVLLDVHRNDFAHIQKQLNQQYLDQVEIKRQAQEGKIALGKENIKEPDLDKEIERALRAFKNRTYKMFVDGLEVIDPDEICTLTEGTKINFIRLIPLVGG